jgi:transcriptional regulator with XRE-family HTH domain
MTNSTSKATYNTLRAVLVACRREAGVTQVELARRLGKPQPFISDIERGERGLDVIEFCALVSALGAQPAEILTRLLDQLPRKIEI